MTRWKRVATPVIDELKPETTSVQIAYEYVDHYNVLRGYAGRGAEVAGTLIDGRLFYLEYWDHKVFFGIGETDVGARAAAYGKNNEPIQFTPVRHPWMEPDEVRFLIGKWLLLRDKRAAEYTQARLMKWIQRTRLRQMLFVRLSWFFAMCAVLALGLSYMATSMLGWWWFFCLPAGAALYAWLYYRRSLFTADLADEIREKLLTVEIAHGWRSP